MKMRRYVLGLFAMLLTLPALAAGIDGRWAATVEGGAAGPVDLLFDLKARGGKLTGTLAAAGMPATPIADGVIEGAEVRFTLSLPMEGGPPLVIRYTGRLDGDELDLVSVFDMGQGPVQTTVNARRVKASG